MVQKTIPLKKRLLSAMGILIVTTLLNLILAVTYIETVTNKTQLRLQETAARTKKLRKIQISFRMEVQEWKNILLRSHNEALGLRYRSQFKNRQEEVRTALKELAANFLNKNFNKMISELIEYHTTMSTEYTKALEFFDQNGFESQSAVDSRIRGIDREFNSHIDQLVAENELAEQRAHVEAKEEVNSTVLKVGIILGSIEILAIIFVLKYSMSLLQVASESEEEMRKSNENLRITLESIGDAVIATDIQGNVTTMNPVAVNLTGWSLEEAKGQPLYEVFKIINALNREKVENPFNKVMATGEIVGLANHTALLSKDGKEYQIADSGAPILDINRKIVGVVLVFRDVTKEYELQDRLNHSQKMDAIGQLAGGVAHDFNNMLGAILGAADVLGRRLEDEKAKKFNGIIIDCAERASSLVDKLLSFARKQPESSTKIDLHEILSDTVTILKNTIDKRISIKINPESEKSLVIGDPSQLQSIFINLGINASHAMTTGGEIFITTSLVELDQKDCDVSSFQLYPGEYIQVDFRDTGTGIPKEALPRIFEPFFTTKEQGQGTGLGLAAVLGTVQQHQGSVTVYSESGKGTSFCILLPAAREGTVSKKIVKVEKSGSGRILVIDDELAMLATAQAILEDLGYEVELAEDGLMGIDVFKSNSDMFDLVLLDMIMPKMNGRDCFFELKKIKPEIKIVLTSGFTLENDLNDIKEAGLSGFVRKPYRSATLSQIVHDVLKS